MKETISRKNHKLVYIYDYNLVDEIWKESRPKPPKGPIRVHDLRYAGLDVASKLASLRSELGEAGSSAIIISMLDEIAWLLNLVKCYLFLALLFDGFFFIIQGQVFMVFQTSAVIS